MRAGLPLPPALHKPGSPPQRGIKVCRRDRKADRQTSPNPASTSSTATAA
jgi:hypothetical protein